MNLTPFSIKEGIDGLPLGLCWYYEDGVVALRNRVMEQLYTTITGGTLYDGNILKEALLLTKKYLLCDGTEEDKKKLLYVLRKTRYKQGINNFLILSTKPSNLQLSLPLLDFTS